jgi:WD40 repeat protein
LNGHLNVVQRLRFSPDSRRLASGSTDGALGLWDSATGARIARNSRIPAPSISLIAFTPDGQWIITESRGNEALLWDGETGKFLDIEFRGHEGPVTALAISSDGRHLVTGSEDLTIRIWSLETFEACGEPLRGHSSGIELLELSNDCLLIASAARGECAIWDMITRVAIQTAQIVHDQVSTISFTPQGRELLSGGNDGSFFLTHLRSQGLKRVKLGYHSSSITCCAISTDGIWAVTGDRDGTICCWDLTLLSSRGKPQIYPGHLLTSITILKDQKQMVLTTLDDIFMICHVDTGKISAGPFRGEDGRSTSWALSPDETHIAIGNRNGGIVLWNLRDLDSTQVFFGDVRSSLISELKLSPDRNIIASSAINCNAVRLWDAKTGREIGGGLADHNAPVLCVAFSHDSKLIITGSQDGSIRIWSIESTTPLLSSIQAQNGAIWALAFTKDDSKFISGSANAMLDVWDVKTGQRIEDSLTKIGHESKIIAVFTLQNNLVLSTSIDGVTVLCEIPIGTSGFRTKVVKHSGRIHPGNITVSWDECYFASAPSLSTMELWTLKPNIERICSLARTTSIHQGNFYFSHDNRHLWYEVELFVLDLPNK